MRPIDRFILHITYNLFPLNEYSDKEINYLITKFKEEADDLNIQISDGQLKKYIERFDQLKNSPKVTDKDLRKYSLSKLIKLVTSSPGAEIPSDEEEDVYREKSDGEARPVDGKTSQMGGVEEDDDDEDVAGVVVPDIG